MTLSKCGKDCARKSPSSAGAPGSWEMAISCAWSIRQRSPKRQADMNVSAWSIRRPLPAILLFILLSAAGLFGFHRLAISQLPDLTLPMVTVTVSLPGASPSTLETQVTRKIENAVASIADIDDLTSSVNEGVSTTTIVFELGRDGNVAKDEVRDAVDRIR